MLLVCHLFAGYAERPLEEQRMEINDIKFALSGGELGRDFLPTARLCN